MKAKIFAKRAVDILMFSLFVYLMNYRVIGGLLFHAWAGIALFVLLVAHNILNAPYWKATFRGKYNFCRALLLATNLLLLIFIILLFASSLFMSGMVFAFSPFRMTWTALALHKFSSAWAFFVMAFHLSLHAKVILKKIDNRICAVKNAKAKIALKIFFAVTEIFLVALGTFSFYKSGIPQAMFFLDAQNKFFTTAKVIFGNAAIVAGMCVVARAVTSDSDEC